MRYLFAICLLALSSCATTAPDAPAVLSQPVDASVQQQVEAQRLAASLQQNGKVKVGKGGTLIIQLGGTGNVATPTATDNRKAGQHQGTAAIGRDASASNASKRTAGPPLIVYVVGCCSC